MAKIGVGWEIKDDEFHPDIEVAARAVNAAAGVTPEEVVGCSAIRRTNSVIQRREVE